MLGDSIKGLSAYVDSGLGKVDDARAMSICVGADAEGRSLAGDNDFGIGSVGGMRCKQDFNLGPNFSLAYNSEGDGGPCLQEHPHRGMLQGATVTRLAGHAQN